MLRNSDVIILLGAGCSRKAGIPTSDMMLTQVHDLLQQGEKWYKFHTIYCCLRGLILRADAMQGKFNESFNIERLVASLGEIEHREQNYLNPFVGTLHPDLIEAAGHQLQLVKEFRQVIVNQLRDWVQLGDYRIADYYQRLFDFQATYNHPLRIFTLNYDLCLEKNLPTSKTLERGFEEKSREWDARRFEPKDTEAPSIYYYKMHGSIDWKRDEQRGNIVKELDSPPPDPDLIFGAVNKLYPHDPYLFYAYEFRKYSLDAKVILIIGYSFSDDHINRILRQALENDPCRKVVAVMPNPDKNAVCARLGGNVSTQVIFENAKAEEYLTGLTPDGLIAKAGITVDDTSDPFAATTPT